MNGTMASSELPRRQSCDRCHELKVRCIREQPSILCVRCTKAGATCIYSIQQRPGRPALGKESFPISSGRKRTRKESKSSEFPSPKLNSNLVSDYTAPTNSAMDNSQIDPCLLGLETSGAEGISEEFGYDVMFDGMPFGIAEWLSQNSGLKNIGLSMGLTPASLSSNTPMMTYENAFLEDFAGSARQTYKPIAEAAKAYFDPMEQHIKHLAELNLSIFRSTCDISETTPLNVSSPYFNEIVENTGALIKILDHFNNPTGTHCQNMPINPDIGACFMILACYERLLCAFEKLCLSIQKHLSAKETETPSGQTYDHMQAIGASMSPVSSSSSISQFVMMLELMSHILERLHRALGPLAQLLLGKRPDANPCSSTSSVGSPTVSSVPAMTPQSELQNETPQSQMEKTGYGGESEFPNNYKAAEFVV